MDRNNRRLATVHNAEVALRKESVDRNFYCSGYFRFSRLSLSARRAWIEINSLDDILAGVNVALRKESVDRNARKIRPVAPDICRSPQGERG